MISRRDTGVKAVSISMTAATPRQKKKHWRLDNADAFLYEELNLRRIPADK